MKKIDPTILIVVLLLAGLNLCYVLNNHVLGFVLATNALVLLLALIYQHCTNSFEVKKCQQQNLELELEIIKRQQAGILANLELLVALKQQDKR